MAGKVTHAVFADSVLKKTKIDNIDMESIKTYSTLPDFPRTNHFNRLIHKSKSNTLFCNMFKYIVSNNLENNIYVRSMFFAFISHYILDSVIHPYVFYKTEYYDRMYNPSKYNRKHHFYERYIDVYYIDKYKLGKFYKYLFNIKINNDISLLLDSVMDETYNVRNTSKYFKKGLLGAKIMFRFKYDKYGIKNIFYKLFGNKFLSYHIDLNKDKYILNLDHNVWYNPKNGEKHNESVLDLYDIAFDRCCVLLKKVDRCLKNNDFKTFKEIIGNDSYVYGLNLKLGSKLKYLEKECKIDEK